MRVFLFEWFRQTEPQTEFDISFPSQARVRFFTLTQWKKSARRNHSPESVRIGNARRKRIKPLGKRTRPFNPNSEVERSDLTQSPDRKGVLSALTVSKDTPPHFRNSYRPAPSANSSPPTSEFGFKGRVKRREIIHDTVTTTFQ